MSVLAITKCPHLQQFPNVPFQIRWGYQNGIFKKSFPLFFFRTPQYPIEKSFNVLKFSVSLHELKTFNRMIKKHGLCHGQCLAMVFFLQQNSGINCLDLLRCLKEFPLQCVIFQIIEIARNYFDDNQADETFYPTTIDIQPKGLFEFTTFNQTIEFLSQIDEGIFILRLWSDRKKTAHSIFLRISGFQEEYYFYNSKSAGLYSYLSRDLFLDNFSSHLKAYFPTVLKNGGHFILERH